MKEFDVRVTDLMRLKALPYKSRFPFVLYVQGFDRKGVYHEVSVSLSKDEMRELSRRIGDAVWYNVSSQEEADLNQLAEEIAQDSTRLAVMPPEFHEFIKNAPEEDSSSKEGSITFLKDGVRIDWSDEA